MTSFLYQNKIPIFGYANFAMALRERVREQATTLAAKYGVEIEHIAKRHIRKEEVVAKVLAERGDHPGLVHVISAMAGAAPSPSTSRPGRQPTAKPTKGPPQTIRRNAHLGQLEH